MLLYVNMIAQIKCLDLKMNLVCSIFTKGKFIPKEFVSEVGVLDWRYKKGVAGQRFLPLFCYFSTINEHTWQMVRSTWRVTLFRMSLSQHQNLTALKDCCNWSKRELLSKVWMMSKTKADKITHPLENMMLISILYHIILVIG